jgi:hypothetical protein
MVDNCLRNVDDMDVRYFTRNSVRMGCENNPKYAVEFRPNNEAYHFYRVEYGIYSNDISLLEIIPSFNFGSEPQIIYHIEGSRDMNTIFTFFQTYMNVFRNNHEIIDNEYVEPVASAAWSQ